MATTKIAHLTMTLRLAPLEEYLAQGTPIEGYLSALLRDREKAVIFDIGACEGEDTIRYARMFPRAHLYAFEALPANQRLLELNLAKYEIKNAELIPLALSNRAGSSTFHVSSGAPAERRMGENWNYGNKSSSLLPPAASEPMYGWLTFQETIEVPCDTLDHFCEARGIRKIDFVHMDVQGAESLVLEGASRMLPHTLSVWLEIANQETYRGQKLRPEIESLMRSRDFRLLYEQSWGPEGDQLYVNLRSPRGFLYWLKLRLKRLLSGQTGSAPR